MSISVFGTCRLTGINNRNNLNEDISYLHSTKEIIQFIHFIKGNLSIPSLINTYCFRTSIMNKTVIPYNDTLRKIFTDTDIFVIELCSKKKYIYNNFFLHHLTFDKRFPYLYYIDTPPDIINNHTIEEQSDEEIENDILEIQKLLFPRKIIIVSHYNSKLNNCYLQSRNELIQLLTTICKKYNIYFVNPTDVLSSYPQNEIMESDLGHYTEKGLMLFTNYINKYIDDIQNTP